MKKIVFVACLLIYGYIKPYCQSSITISNLKCEYQINPLSLETQHPRMSWQLFSGKRDQVQTAFRLLVASSMEDLDKDKGDIWDSKKTISAQSIQVEYAGKPLLPSQKYYWKVKIWDNSGIESPWSSSSFWTMGLLTASDWGKATWISMDDLNEAKYPGMDKKAILEKTKNILPQFRKDFDVTKPVRNATIYISGLGQFDLHVNGTKVGDHFMDPGWTNYEKYAYYVTFDITSLLKEGKNALGVMLGNGFYHIPPGRYRKADLVTLHGLPKLKCKLIVQYNDGSSQTIDSNESWKVSRSPITYGTIYGGEDFDATLLQEGWDIPGFNDASWQNSVAVRGNDSLRSQLATPNKVMERFTPVSLFKSGKGKWVYDLGQNASGIIRIKVKGKPGESVKVYPAELIDPDSSASQRATGSPYCFTYTMKSDGVETWQPQFSYYGFRYVQLDGGVPKGKDNPESLPEVIELTGLHTRNAAESTGTFRCSNDLFNKTNALIDWAVKSNMSSVLTDCPHREKLGWLEQTYLMGPSIQYNYDISRLYTKTINDMQSSQTGDGMIPAIAPEYCIFNDKNGKPSMFRDSPEWGSAGIILPWYMYLWYGDKQLLSGNYDMMKKYLAYLFSKSNNYIISFGLGDWYDLGPQRPGVSQLTSLGVTGTATWYYDVTILTKIAQILNKKEDITKFRKLSADIKNAFNKNFFHPDSFYYDRNSQTANAMALYMGLVEPQFKEKVLQNLIKDIRSRNNALSAGDIGYRYVLQALWSNGASNVIYDMNCRSDVPGYGYQLKQGATALTESWQALRNVSNDHLMLGHLMEWFYSGLAGIGMNEDSPAFKNIIIKPEIVGDISSAKASFSSMYGTISSEWKIVDSSFELTVVIPVNTEAVVYLPSADPSSVYENGKPVEKEKDIRFAGREKDRLLYKIGSGTWTFKCAYR